MGTTELALPKLVEILGPDGDYEKQRIALRGEYAAVVAEAQKITAIENAEDAEAATRIGRLLQVASKETETFFKGVKSQVDAIKKPILDAEKADSAAFEFQKKRLGDLQTTWNRKVREQQEAEERKAREEALRNEQEAVLLRAIELESIEGTEAALEVLEEPIVALPTVSLSKAPVKPAGSVSKFTYSSRLVSLKALVDAIAAGKAPIQAIEWNESWCNSQARAYKDAYSIPGTELKKVENTHYRS